MRIVAETDPDDPSEAEQVGRLGQAHWFGAERAWFVTVTGFGTVVHPSEHLDFAPTARDEEVAGFHTYISSSRGRDS